MNIESIFKKLNIIEQTQLKKYIAGQVSLKCAAAAKEMIDSDEKFRKDCKRDFEKTLDVISIAIKVGMRENHISEQRYEKIEKDIIEHINKQTESPNKLVQLSTNFEILSKNEYLDYLEIKMDKCCNKCRKDPNKCKFYSQLVHHNIETMGRQIGKCKYAYLNNNGIIELDKKEQKRVKKIKDVIQKNKSKKVG